MNKYISLLVAFARLELANFFGSNSFGVIPFWVIATTASIGTASEFCFLEMVLFEGSYELLMLW